MGQTCGFSVKGQMGIPRRDLLIDTIVKSESQSLSLRTSLYLTLNKYRFEYLSPSLLLSPKDITSTPWTDPLPGAIHMISGFERLKDFASDLKTIRARYDENWEPKIVWEPHMVSQITSSWPTLGADRAVRHLSLVHTPFQGNHTYDRCYYA